MDPPPDPVEGDRGAHAAIGWPHPVWGPGRLGLWRPAGLGRVDEHVRLQRKLLRQPAVDLVGEVLRLVGSHLVIEGDPGGNDETVRPHVHGAQFQQSVHAGPGLDFLAYQLLHLGIGGWIVVHEPLANPPPRSNPQLGALATYWALLHEVMEFAGVPRGAIEGLPGSAREAGLDIAEADGFFCTQDPEIGFEIHAGSLAAARERAVEAGIAAEMVDDLVATLRTAKAGGYEWVTSPFLLDLVLRKPKAM